MAAPRTRKGKGTEQTNALLAALNTIRIAQEKSGHVGETHCRVKSGWIIASNGPLSIGVRVATAFEANPNTSDLMLALSKTGEQVVFTVEPNQKLLIKSGRFKAYVGTVADEYVPTVVPDIAVAKVNNKLIEALEVCATVCDESLDNAMFRGVLINGYTCAATDRHSIIEFWHGIDLPKGAIIPKTAIKALGGREVELTEIGFSNTTFTFHFADGSFVKTSLYEGRFPNVQRVLDDPANYQSIPPDFFNALYSILDFSDGGTIYFGEALLSTVHPDDTRHAGATYEVAGISKGRIFNGTRLKLLEKYATAADFYTQGGCMFRGKSCRGIIARRAGG